MLCALNCCEPDPDCLDPLSFSGVLRDLILVFPLLGSGIGTVASAFGRSECEAIGRTLGRELGNMDNCEFGSSCALLSSDAGPCPMSRLVLIC